MALFGGPAVCVIVPLWFYGFIIRKIEINSINNSLNHRSLTNIVSYDSVRKLKMAQSSLLVPQIGIPVNSKSDPSSLDWITKSSIRGSHHYPTLKSI